MKRCGNNYTSRLCILIEQQIRRFANFRANIDAGQEMSFEETVGTEVLEDGWSLAMNLGGVIILQSLCLA